MYYNIHTHYYRQQENVVSVYNRYRDFNAGATKGLYTAGLHPWYLHPETMDGELQLLEQLVTDKNLLAIGECGLDKITDTPWHLQEQAFTRQIILAQQYHKPLIIHCVKAFSETLLLLKHVTVPVIFHGVNNKLSVVQPVINAGYYLSFGKSLLHPNPSVSASFLATPLNRLFLETDDMEVDIREVYKSAAKIRNIAEKEILLQLEKNFNTVFHDAGF